MKSHEIAEHENAMKNRDNIMIITIIHWKSTAKCHGNSRHYVFQADLI